MDPASLPIPVRSRRQAMDWSLVLISQGIESAIEPAELANGWVLVVAAADYERALDAIRQYRAENRSWPWQREVVLPEILFDTGCFVWALLLAVFHALTWRMPALRTAGLMDNAAVSHGEVWRLFTAVLLHENAGHLASNLAVGCVLLGLVMGRFGTGIGLLAAYLAGVGGNVVVWLACPASHRSLGASGMVMGALGLLAVQSFTRWQGGARAAKTLLTAVAGGALLFVLIGMSPDTDVVAHGGGFVTGLVFGLALVALRLPARSGRLNLAAGLLFAGLVIGTWWLALR